MASDLARGCNEQLINSQFGQTLYNQNPGLMSLSAETFSGNSSMESTIRLLSDEGGSSSSYAMASDDSRYNDETRQVSATEDSGVQNSRVGLVQRSTLAPASSLAPAASPAPASSLAHASSLAPAASLENNGMMYVLALLLPLVSVHNFDIQWRCTTSAVLRATELFLIQLSRFIRKARVYIRQLARDQIARDLFATAMDIVLVVYAIGFLFLSLYQASIFA